MLKIGDVVCVQTKGVCEVCGIEKKDMGVFENEFYVLKPVFIQNNMTIYFPTNSKVKVRKIVSKKVAEKAIADFSKIEELLVSQDENRVQFYENIAKECEFESSIKLLKHLLKRKSSINKKNIQVQEQKILSQIESQIIDELAYVLEKKQEDIKNEIVETVSMWKNWTKNAKS